LQRYAFFSNPQMLLSKKTVLFDSKSVTNRAATG